MGQGQVDDFTAEQWKAAKERFAAEAATDDRNSDFYVSLESTMAVYSPRCWLHFFNPDYIAPSVMLKP